MGFQLFESSGTFNPSDWGLKAGDIISIICVGGGGAGCTNETAGKTGSASSFGSILSAAGGSGGAVGGTPGTVGAYYGSAESANNQGGCGAGGWYPGVIYCGGNGISQSIKGLTIYSSAGVPSTCIFQLEVEEQAHNCKLQLYLELKALLMELVLMEALREKVLLWPDLEEEVALGMEREEGLQFIIATPFQAQILEKLKKLLIN